jgi:hypothetical protein
VTRIIYKYQVGDHGVIVRGDNQKVILVGIDPKTSDYLPCIWVELHHPLADAIHDPQRGAQQQRVQYLIMGTGWNMEDDESYHVGSAITADGLVWHVYGKRL